VEASASLAFRTNNAGMMKPVPRGHHIKAADVAEIVEVAKIVRLLMYVGMGDTKSVREE
jgi:hypothetical protein